jgi:hypothetical protein
MVHHQGSLHTCMSAQEESLGSYVSQRGEVAAANSRSSLSLSAKLCHMLSIQRGEMGPTWTAVERESLCVQHQVEDSTLRIPH